MLPLVLEIYLVVAATVLESYLVDAAPGTGELPC
jgi:hypothetical protein